MDLYLSLRNLILHRIHFLLLRMISIVYIAKRLSPCNIFSLMARRILYRFLKVKNICCIGPLRVISLLWLSFNLYIFVSIETFRLRFWNLLMAKQTAVDPPLIGTWICKVKQCDRKCVGFNCISFATSSQVTITWNSFGWSTLTPKTSIATLSYGFVWLLGFMQ